MSKSEWEYGKIRFGAREWAPFRKAVIKRYNQYQAKLYELNCRVHSRVAKAITGTRGKSRTEAIQRTLARELLGSEMSRHEFPEIIDKLAGDFSTNVPWLGIDYLNREPEDIVKIRVAKQKDYPRAPVSRSFHLGSPEGFSLALNNESRTLYWTVHENNRACERAHEVTLVRDLFNQLSRVKFSRGYGGEIVGNDECNEDAMDAGGGGNYIKYSYASGVPREYQGSAHVYQMLHGKGRGNDFVL